MLGIEFTKGHNYVFQNHPFKIKLCWRIVIWYEKIRSLPEKRRLSSILPSEWGQFEPMHIREFTV